MEIITSIIKNILVALYQPFWFAVILSVFFMFLWKKYPDVKSAAKEWAGWFKSDPSFRRMFLLVFYTVMILFRTLLNRQIWANPVSNVIGLWGLYKESNGEMVLTTEVPENLALFIPFTVLLLWCYKERFFTTKDGALRISLIRSLWLSFKITFIFSFCIEFLQLFLRLGTWQLSDLFFNTLGGGIGGFIYWAGYHICHFMNKDYKGVHHE
ncbi:MAG: VanZ family protein [Eubacteriales bacterium]|nr:VanZ family protein [Eubacteriales bacterium]